MHRTVLTLSLMLVASGLSLMAQTPSPNATQQVHADLNQLMRGVLYPAANVVFSAQTDDPGEVKIVAGHDPSMSTDPLTSTFGGWQAVENAALALAESANLLSIPERRCANGVPVPTTDPAWAIFVQQVRDASMKSYVAARAKDQARSSSFPRRSAPRVPAAIASGATAGRRPTAVSRPSALSPACLGCLRALFDGRDFPRRHDHLVHLHDRG